MQCDTTMTPLRRLEVRLVSWNVAYRTMSIDFYNWMQDQRCLVPTVLPNQLDYELLKRLIARSSHPVIILYVPAIFFHVRPKLNQTYVVPLFSEPPGRLFSTPMISTLLISLMLILLMLTLCEQNGAAWFLGTSASPRNFTLTSPTSEAANSYL